MNATENRKLMCFSLYKNEEVLEVILELGL